MGTSEWRGVLQRSSRPASRGPGQKECCALVPSSFRAGLKNEQPRLRHGDNVQLVPACHACALPRMRPAQACRRCSPMCTQRRSTGWGACRRRVHGCRLLWARHLRRRRLQLRGGAASQPAAGPVRWGAGRLGSRLLEGYGPRGCPPPLSKSTVVCSVPLLPGLELCGLACSLPQYC